MTTVETMKAAVVTALDAPWEVKAVPRPRPGPAQVLIRVRASGLCYTDVHLSQGGLLPLELPAVLGHEPVGEIVEIGSAVRTRKVGDRVGTSALQAGCGRCEWCSRGDIIDCADQKLLMIHRFGGHAEYLVAEEAATMLLPDGLSFEQAAPIFCAGNTVWSGLRAAEPLPGARVAVVGIGGLGHLALQYAKAAGFRAIAITRSKDKHALSRELGADEVVEDGEALARIGGADVILSTANSYRTASDALRGLRPRGSLVVMGAAGPEEDLVIPNRTVFPQMMVNRQKILFSQQNGREFVHEAVQLAASGKIRVLTETYSLDDARKAYDRVSAGAVRFRAVLVP
ncbi:alcohol dehydrogenase catalytic domain-containing protein [Pendulispora albinea]|uniref:alcohol dehydrogenase n=1 Tax=Pendulispora albinea TaxID=2741071 RepID=A0ABZ2LQ32_9BACT